MSDIAHEVHDLIMRLPCRVELPIDYGNFFDVTGPLPPTLKTAVACRAFIAARLPR